MTKIAMIAAVAQNGVIGNKSNNDIPWRISEDFLHFKNLTMGFPCIMGRITFESIPPKFRPLTGRENIVLTKNKKFKAEGTTIFNTLEETIHYLNQNKAERAYITGGSTIYKLGLEIADIFELTRVHREFDGDVFFPEVNWNQWELLEERNQKSINKISGEPIEYSFLTYHRIM
jgi:dihydrofolate reductase